MANNRKISIDYQYDKNNRLVKCLVPGENATEFTYDSAGNLLFCGDASMQRVHKPVKAKSQQATEPARTSVDSEWNCVCGSVNAGKFCSGCGKPKPVKSAPVTDGSWQCSCGRTNRGDFCPKCGVKRSSVPSAPVDGSWLCSCGRTNRGDFCPKCGAKRSSVSSAPADGSWQCSCGRSNKGDFCPKCGAKRP